MNCFICKKEFYLIESLVTHLKIYHSLSQYSNFQCSEESCLQEFNNIYSFKRHIKKKHSCDKPSVNSALFNQSKFHDITEINSEITKQNAGVSDSNNYNQETCDIDEYLNIPTDLLFNAAVNFTILLHNNKNFTKKNVEDIQKLVSNTFLCAIADNLKYFIDYIPNLRIRTLLQKLIANISEAFDVCKTDYLMNKWLKENDLMMDSVQFSINETVCPIVYHGDVVYDEVNTKGILLPLKFQFKKYFEKPDVLKNTLNKINICQENPNEYFNFTQGYLWKKKMSMYNADEICIPYFLYFDDFEINNPLGTHCQPICGIYYSFPLCEINHIFVAGFIKSKDIKKFGNDASLNYLISQLNEMEHDGIFLDTANGKIKIRFILGLILGDNLGLNSLLGFSKSFSSTFFCRFCKAPKQLTQEMNIEEQIYLRNVENYEDDLKKYSAAETGIIENSPFNNITSFHVIENYAVDIMHDFFEGICHYDICHIIRHYTQNTKYFSLDIFNLRKQNFNYGLLEVGNFTRPILEKHLNQFRLKMTASEMKSFIRLFPLIIGDLIPEDDSVWHFLQNLLKIINLLLKISLTNDDISLLHHLISEHNEKYISLFSDTLKPKHHLITHYPTIIKYSGPPKHFWCFRFEANHKEIKAYANVTTSRKNILLTLANKYQLKFSHLIITGNENKISYENSHIIESKNTSIVFSKLKIEPTKIIALNQIRYKGTQFKSGQLLTKFFQNLSVFEIVNIYFLQESSQVILLLNEILVKCYNSHYDSYELDPIKTIISENLVLKIEEFNVKPINIHRMIDGKLMIRLKEYF